MKNLVNYLDEYMDDNGLTESIKLNKKDKEQRAILKAARKQSREEEIRQHGKPISYNNVTRDRSKYSRKDKHKQRY